MKNGILFAGLFAGLLFSAAAQDEGDKVFEIVPEVDLEQSDVELRPKEEQGAEADVLADAARAYLEEHTKEKDRFEILMKLGQVSQMQNRYGRALSAYQKALELRPDDPAARFSVATSLIQTGQHEEALRMMYKLIEDYPEDYRLKNNLAWLFATTEVMSLRNGKLAEKLAQEALFAAPYDMHVWSTLAEARFMLGDYKGAQRAVGQAIKLGVALKIPQQNLNSFVKQQQKVEMALSTDEALQSMQ